jgi:PAS domain S-box-containing protein
VAVSASAGGSGDEDGAGDEGGDGNENENENDRILVFVEHEENRRLLADWLGQEYEILEGESAADLDGAFDLCILDRASVERYDEALRARKERETPVLLPYLFVVPQRELDRLGGDVWSRMDAVVRERVDELITTPIKKAELRGRLENLLNSRGLSLELREQREQYRRLLSVAPETIATVDAAGAVSYLNARGAELFGADDPESLYGESLYAYVHEGERDDLRSMVESVAESGEQAGFMEARVVGEGAVRHVEIGAASITYEREPAVQLVIRDVTDRHHREQQVARQRDQLEKLNRLNDVIRQIDQALVRAASREEIEQAVCDRLVEVDRYVAAWIGNDRATSRELSVRAAAGALDGYLDEIVVTAGGSEATGAGPSGRALTGREVAVVGDVAADPAFEPWREAALERGFRSSIAVPIVYGDTLYGVVNVYADRADAFDADERDVLAELGETIGHAINAAESKRALLADRVIELRLRLHVPEAFLVRASGALDRAFTFEGMVSNADGTYIEFFAVDGAEAEAEAVLELAAESDGVRRARHVGDHGGEALFEFVFEHDRNLVVQSLGELGAGVEELVVADGAYEATVELPYDADVHTVLEALERRYPDVDLLAQRERERPVESRQTVWTEFRESLTDRQWSAVQTAYYAGFFDWPRTSTGEEVAESLDISPATFHEHLRAAQRKLLAALLEG